MELNSKILQETIVSFFRIFEATVELDYVNDNFVTGNALWDEEDDFQRFIWYFEKDSTNFYLLKKICLFLKANSLVKSDVIIISEMDLRDLLLKSNWKNEEINIALDNLLSIDVRMIDDGEETDAFFLHW